MDTEFREEYTNKHCIRKDRKNRTMIASTKATRFEEKNRTRQDKMILGECIRKRKMTER